MTPEDRIALPEPDQAPVMARDSRRRLLKGGFAVAPALLTLVNRPVLAAPCKLASSHLSASLSRPTSGLFECAGRKPSSWAALDEASWPSGTRATLFSVAVGSSATYGANTLLQVVSLSSNMGAEGLAKHLAAAYLNAVTSLTPAAVLDVITVKNIWASFTARGFYEPTGGIQWFPDSALPPNPQGGLIAWLMTTMPS